MNESYPPEPSFGTRHLQPRSSSSGDSGSSPEMPVRRKRGRPLEMTHDELLTAIRRLASRREGLFRIHHTHSGLYARARRLHGSWSAAVRAAGLDYESNLRRARQQSRSRRRATNSL